MFHEQIIILSNISLSRKEGTCQSRCISCIALKNKSHLAPPRFLAPFCDGPLGALFQAFFCYQIQARVRVLADRSLFFDMKGLVNQARIPFPSRVLQINRKSSDEFLTRIRTLIAKASFLISAGFHEPLENILHTRQNQLNIIFGVKLHPTSILPEERNA